MLIQTATFEGSVHGVVVQIINEHFFFILKLNKEAILFNESLDTSNETSIAFEFLSWYSTSASASAEPQSWHQWTGFSPLCKWLFFIIIANALKVSASKEASELL